MRPYRMGHVPPKPSKDVEQIGQGTSTTLVSTRGITLVAMEFLFGNPVNLPTELLSQFRCPRPYLAGHLLLENIGVLPSLQRGGEKSGPLSVEMSLISASMWQGPMNSKENTPFSRVFHAQELQHALRLAGGDLEKASALLWSIKEAVVKALGCGFHLV